MDTQLSPLNLGGQNIPRFFYGTAWKEERTSDLVFAALQAGFTAIDTANQRKHYHEEGVGQGLKKFLGSASAQRETLFLQTKFTYARGQDHRKPYKDSDSYTQQVADSFASSLAHLHTDYLDSYVLHGPYDFEGIGDEDFETWAAMESLVDQKKVKFLGVSNVSPEQLESLFENSRIKPTFVQNRCYAAMGWDRTVREICANQNMIYQGFSLLTANRLELAHPRISEIAAHYDKTIAQVVFRFCQQLGMICLTGTTSPEHMKQDLDICDFELSPDEISEIETFAVVGALK